MQANSLLTPATGKVPAHAVAPDPIEGSRHDVKRGRTKHGPTAEVKRYGLAHVVGSWTGTATNEHGELNSYPVLATVLEQSGSLKRGAYGVSALDVYRLTQRLYGDVIPPLLSTDNQQHHAVVHGDDSDTDDYAIAWHNPADPYAACDATGRTVPDSTITYPRRGYGLTFGLPTECVTDRWKVAAWLAGQRETSSAEAGRVMARRARTGPESVKRPPSRFALKSAARRAGDPVNKWTALHNGYGAAIAVALGHAAYRWELLAPSADREHVWRGHSFIARPTPRNGITVGGKRKRQTVKRRTVEHVDAVDYAALLARFATLANGERITFTVKRADGSDHAGSFTRANDGRYSLDSPTVRVRSVRTLLAVERKLQHAA